jgi:hypothetical protein
MKYARLLLVALLVLIVLSSGCVGFMRDTYKNIVSPSPSATAPATSTPIPINQSIERQYNYADRLNAGLINYNNAIVTANESRIAYESASWETATTEITQAKVYMEQARMAFLSMKAFAATADETSLAEKWNETAYYETQAFEFMNQSYQEARYQASRTFAEQNPIKYNYYVGQANYYISLAKQSRSEAEALEMRTFIGQQGRIISS